jgi:hypothetical protein
MVKRREYDESWWPVGAKAFLIDSHGCQPVVDGHGFCTARFRDRAIACVNACVYLTNAELKRGVAPRDLYRVGVALGCRTESLG